MCLPMKNDEVTPLKMTQNIRKRARLCLQENGGLFEHLLKIKDFNLEPELQPEE